MSGRMRDELRQVMMDCEESRAAMVDAATDDLAAGERAKFEAHVQGCAACREELQRIKMLLGEIDRGVTAEVAAEPSADLLRNVRQRIAEGSAVKNAMPHRWVALAACAAMMMTAAMLIMRAQRGNSLTTGEGVRVAATNSPSAPPAIQPGEASKTLDARSLAMMATAGRMATRGTQPRERDQDVVVPQGEMQLVMKLAVMLKTAQAEDGSAVVVKLNQARTAEPLEIKPLEIAPLDAANEGTASAGGGTDGANLKFVDSGKKR